MKERKNQVIEDIFKAGSVGGVGYQDNGTWLRTLGKLASHPNLRRAWSDDESTATSLSGSTSTKSRNILQPSYDASTMASKKDGLPSFHEWLEMTSNFTHMVSEQISQCTTATMDSVKYDEGFTLKDEDFFWSHTSQSFDTIDTRKTSDNSTFSLANDAHRPKFQYEQYRRHSDA